jgi:glycosyltransferase involved in cell wall biosynthesis
MDFIINGRFLTQRTTGVQRYARELVGALDAILDSTAGIKITVMSPRLSNPPPAWRNIELQQVGRLQGHAWEQLELPWYSRGKLLFCPGNTAPAISLLGSQPVVVTVHDLSYRYFPDTYHLAFRLWYGSIVPLVLRHARAVITVSETERLAILAHYPEIDQRLCAIQNGGLPADFGERLNNVSNRGYVLYVGSLSKRKNFPNILDVATRLARKRNLQFVFVGSTLGGIYNTNVKTPIELASFINFAGQIDDPRALSSYYKHAACLLFPSLYEASPLPPIEAMACGCPVVASDIPSLRERCGDAALYCNPHDIDSIATATERIIDDNTLQQRLRTLGYQRAATFTWEQCARQTLHVICNSVKNGTPGWTSQPN